MGSTSLSYYRQWALIKTVCIKSLSYRPSMQDFPPLCLLFFMLSNSPHNHIYVFLRRLAFVSSFLRLESTSTHMPASIVCQGVCQIWPDHLSGFLCHYCFLPHHLAGIARSEFFSGVSSLVAGSVVVAARSKNIQERTVFFLVSSSKDTAEASHYTKRFQDVSTGAIAVVLGQPSSSRATPTPPREPFGSG